MQQLYANYSLLMIMLGAGIITLLLQSIAGHVMNDLLEECSKIAGTKNPWIRNLIKKFQVCYELHSGKRCGRFCGQVPVRIPGISNTIIYLGKCWTVWGMVCGNVFWGVYDLWDIYSDITSSLWYVLYLHRYHISTYFWRRIIDAGACT